MTGITSKVQICNMTLSQLGNFGTIEDIDTPTNKKEITFALWYDVARQACLRYAMPNFAMERRIVGKRADTPAFGYTYEYEYPSDCLRLLGLNEIDANKIDHAVEGQSILMNDDLTSGLKLRFIKDIEDVTLFTADFKILLSEFLMAYVAMDITQDPAKAKEAKANLPSAVSQLSGINAQENPPVRKSESKFKQARQYRVQRNEQRS